MNIKVTYLLVMLLFTFASCDCTRYTNAYVADYETKQAVKGAQVYSYAALDGEIRDERIRYTDSSGWFETAFSLKGVAKCGSLKIVISKDGYQTMSKVDWPIGDTIFLFRIN